MSGHHWKSNYESRERLVTRLDAARDYLHASGGFGFDFCEARHVSGKDIVNVGCGTGSHDVEMLRRLAAIPSSYVLVDRSETLIAEAAAGVRGIVDCVTTVQSDVNDWEPTHASADLIVCMHVLYHVEEPGSVIQKLGNAVRPSGLVIVTTGTDQNNRELIDVACRVANRFGVQPPKRAMDRFDSSNAGPLLGSVFASCDAKLREARLVFPGVREFFDYYASMAYFQDVLDAGHSPESVFAVFAEESVRWRGQSGRYEVTKDCVTYLCRRRANSA